MTSLMTLSGDSPLFINVRVNFRETFKELLRSASMWTCGVTAAANAWLRG